MPDERLRVPIETEYALAIGVAVYCFATLEWNAVWCCERIEPGSIEGLEDRTAGRVADTIVKLVKGINASDEQIELEKAAQSFRSLVATRNNLLHAKPGTAFDGTQGLFRHGDHWTIDELQGVADAFTRCSLELNEALYGLLASAGDMTETKK